MTQIYCVAAPTRQLMENMVVTVANARILELCYVSRTVCYCGRGRVLRLDDVISDASTCCPVVLLSRRRDS